MNISELEDGRARLAGRNAAVQDIGRDGLRRRGDGAEEEQQRQQRAAHLRPSAFFANSTTNATSFSASRNSVTTSLRVLPATGMAKRSVD